MNKHYSNQLLDDASSAGSQTEVDISQRKPRESIQIGEHTSSIIGWILRGGVIFSASIILIGFLLLLAHSGGVMGYSVGIGTFPRTLVQVWSGLLVWQPQAIIATGLLLLIATPVLTVTTSIVAFGVERDRRFVVIGIVVLAILLTSMLIGKGGS